jgi:crotonobetainyl-CoA:carnitine CoA-transferase CaiB-like acyl-CoA transferase
LLDEVFAKRSKREWLELLEAAGVPNGPINDVAQVFDEPQVKARGVRIELEHAAAGHLPMVASPMRFSATPADYRRAPPLLGEHTAQVLHELLGKSDAEIEALRAARVI